MIRRILPNGSWQYMVKNGIIALPYLTLLRFVIFLLPSPSAREIAFGPGIFNLIVAAPEGQAGMIPQTPDVVNGF
ncbi:hypothetical protein DSECCO2_583380 [anaerobic digester metagenome]